MAFDLALFSTYFVTFFVLIDAPGVAPIFAALTKDGSPSYRRSMAIRSVLIAALILTGFAFGGAWLLAKLGITLDAFRAAGGILLFLIALDMVFEKRTERREQRAEDVMSGYDTPSEPDDVSVFPMAIPMLAGPGSIASAMLFMSDAEGAVGEQAAVLAALGTNLALALVIFLAAGPLVKLMGDAITGAITRILGVILSALSVQLMIDGIKGAFGLG